MRLHRERILRLPGDERHLFEREFLHIAHAHHFLIRQWNIPALRKLLDEILPKNTFFKGFEVIHEFPAIGRKVMILNARQIHSKQLPPIILLAMEDMTEMMAVAETLAGHANAAELRFAEKTQKLELHVGELEKEVNELKKKLV